MKCGRVRSAAFIHVGVIAVDGLEGGGVEGWPLVPRCRGHSAPPPMAPPTPDTPLTTRGYPLLKRPSAAVPSPSLSVSLIPTPVPSLPAPTRPHPCHPDLACLHSLCVYSSVSCFWFTLRLVLLSVCIYEHKVPFGETFPSAAVAIVGVVVVVMMIMVVVVALLTCLAGENHLLSLPFYHPLSLLLFYFFPLSCITSHSFLFPSLYHPHPSPLPPASLSIPAVIVVAAVSPGA